VERVLGPLAALSLFGMMALTFVGVFARYVFNHPIAGDSEIQAFLLGFTVFAAVPIVTHHQRHIAIRSFAALLKGRALAIQRGVVLAMTGIGFGALAYFLYIQADMLQEEGDLTTYLDIPEAPFIYFFAILLGIAALVAFERLYAFIRGRADAIVVETELPGLE
jgi:TRAP-type C4-dicarboxylate transport system permease small subunit